MSTPIYQTDVLACAAQLLVDIAGPEPVHIEMSARGPKKYYDVHRPLNEQDARAHLAGYRTKGATLRHPDGKTRALCYDADTPDHWQLLVETVRILAAQGYLPLLEVSPVGRGGHYWIIFTDLVRADAAQRHLLSLAPILQQIYEYWPGSGLRGHKVRLPAGKYVQPGFAAWCTLTDMQSTLLAADGPGAASVLLAYQTPAELVPKAILEQDADEPGAELASRPSGQKVQVQARAYVGMGKVDNHWQHQYNRSTLWFQFTPRQLASLYNEQHPLLEQLPLEKNGMAFSPSVPERTPSTAITSDGLAWVDFSAQSLQPDGKHDGGDALELEARRNGERKAAKSVTLREVARTLVREARDALERAARAGEELPTWVTGIMTEAGWKRYRFLCAEAARTGTGTASRGVTGFVPAEMITQGAQASMAERGMQPNTLTHSVSHESSQKQDSPEALAVDICAQIGQPCSRCGCTLFYQSGSYRMCHQCFPRPAKFGRLTDDEWQRLRTLFPRKPVPMALSDFDWRKR
jgi:hypothetical protein